VVRIKEQKPWDRQRFLVIVISRSCEFAGFLTWQFSRCRRWFARVINQKPCSAVIETKKSPSELGPPDLNEARLALALAETELQVAQDLLHRAFIEQDERAANKSATPVSNHPRILPIQDPPDTWPQCAKELNPSR
jgi:hypothetical protein